MMPTCREIARLLASDELDGAGPVRKALVRLHLLMCDECGRYARELQGLGQAAREALRQPLDPERLVALERIILQRAAGGAAGAG